MSESMHTIALTMAYDGAPFSGFAQQPGQLTVQGSLHDALALLYRHPIETTCAGRTDSGVHARAQVVSFDLDENDFSQRPLESLRRSLNALIDDRAAVTAISEKEPGFSARFDALFREYRYFIHMKDYRPVLLEGHVWHVGRELDIDAMRQAAAYLIGEHDFKSFCMAVSAVGKPTKRNVYEIDIFMEESSGEEVLVIKVVGNAFLHSMVRVIVGTLTQIGLKKKEPYWVKEVLEAYDRRAAGETAPAEGLVFWNVGYSL